MITRPIRRRQKVRQDLHVAGQNDQIDPLLLDQSSRRFLIRLGVAGHRQVIKRKAVAASEGREIPWFDTMPTYRPATLR